MAFLQGHQALDLRFTLTQYNFILTYHICKDSIPQVWSHLQELEIRASVYLLQEYNLLKNTPIPFSFLAMVL